MSSWRHVNSSQVQCIHLPLLVIRNLQTDPLIHHGCHFGGTVYAFANMHALLVSGISIDEDVPPETQQFVANDYVSLCILN